MGASSSTKRRSMDDDQTRRDQDSYDLRKRLPGTLLSQSKVFTVAEISYEDLFRHGVIDRSPFPREEHQQTKCLVYPNLRLVDGTLSDIMLVFELRDLEDSTIFRGEFSYLRDLLFDDFEMEWNGNKSPVINLGETLSLVRVHTDFVFGYVGRLITNHIFLQHSDILCYKSSAVDAVRLGILSSVPVSKRFGRLDDAEFRAYPIVQSIRADGTFSAIFAQLVSMPRRQYEETRYFSTGEGRRDLRELKHVENLLNQPGKCEIDFRILIDLLKTNISKVTDALLREYLEFRKTEERLRDQ